MRGMLNLWSVVHEYGTNRMTPSAVAAIVSKLTSRVPRIAGEKERKKERYNLC
jgi:hypothetical protein